LASLTEGTDGVVEHEISVASSVAGTAISVGQGGGLEPLQVVGSVAGMLKKTKTNLLLSSH
jgi:hypothetical protein